MTTAVEEINEQARAIRPARAVLSWIAALLFALGWITCRVFAILWLIGAWLFVATREGWRAAKLSHEPGRPG